MLFINSSVIASIICESIILQTSRAFEAVPAIVVNFCPSVAEPAVHADGYSLSGKILNTVRFACNKANCIEYSKMRSQRSHDLLSLLLYSINKCIYQIKDICSHCCYLI